MKTLKTVFTVAILLVTVSFANAQNNKLDAPLLQTKIIKVDGVCDMCKHRIESAIKKSSDVNYVNWDIDTKMLTVTYYRNKIKSEEIEKMIAAVGHDTKNIKANSRLYNALPDCCKYRNNQVS